MLFEGAFLVNFFKYFVLLISDSWIFPSVGYSFFPSGSLSPLSELLSCGALLLSFFVTFSAPCGESTVLVNSALWIVPSRKFPLWCVFLDFAARLYPTQMSGTCFKNVSFDAADAVVVFLTFDMSCPSLPVSFSAVNHENATFVSLLLLQLCCRRLLSFPQTDEHTMHAESPQISCVCAPSLLWQLFFSPRACSFISLSFPVDKSPWLFCHVCSLFVVLSLF